MSNHTKHFEMNFSTFLMVSIALFVFRSVNGSFLNLQFFLISCLHAKFFSDAREQVLQFVLHLATWQMTAIHPDERQCHRLPRHIGHRIGQQLLVAAISLTQLALHAVAVDGMLEMPLGHADDDACRRLSRLSLYGRKDHS